MIFGLAALLLANAATILGANALRRRFCTESPGSELVHLLLFRLLLISAAVLACGLLRVLNATTLAAVSVAALVPLVLLRSHRDLPRLPIQGASRPVLIAFALVAVRLLLQVWIFAPHQGDAVSYHLPKMAEWIRAGAFTRELGAHSHVTFPGGFELVETWWTVFLRHDVLVEMAGLEFVLLAAAAVLVIARRCGLSDRAAAFAALFFVLTPGFHLGATSALNDAPAAALTLAMVAMVLDGSPLPLIVAVAGIGVGVKPTFGFALTGVALLLLLQKRLTLAELARAPKPAWTCAVFGLAAGSYWYLRNWAWFGNPFHPLGTPGFQDPTYVQFGPRWMSLPQNLASLIDQRIYDSAGIMNPNVDHMAGWGAVAFACGLVALVDACRESSMLRRVTAAVSVSMLTTMLFVQNDAWCLKYLFYVPAVLALAAAWRMDRTPELNPVGWLAAAFCFAMTMVSYDLPMSRAVTLAREPWRTRSLTAYSPRTGSADSPDDAVGYYGSPIGPSYVLYRPDFSRRVVYFRDTRADLLLEAMAREQIRDLFAPAPTPEQKAVLEEARRSGRLQERDEVWWSRLP